MLKRINKFNVAGEADRFYKSFWVDPALSWVGVDLAPQSSFIARSVYPGLDFVNGASDSLDIFYLWLIRQCDFSRKILGLTNKLGRTEKNKKWRSLAFKNLSIARANLIAFENFIRSYP